MKREYVAMDRLEADGPPFTTRESGYIQGVPASNNRADRLKPCRETTTYAPNNVNSSLGRYSTPPRYHVSPKPCPIPLIKVRLDTLPEYEVISDTDLSDKQPTLSTGVAPAFVTSCIKNPAKHTGKSVGFKIMEDPEEGNIENEFHQYQNAGGMRQREPRVSLLGKPLSYRQHKRGSNYRWTQARIYNYLERPKDCSAVLYHLLVFLMVFLCLVFSVLATIPKYENNITRGLFFLENVMVVWFMSEYLLRVWSAGCRSRYQGLQGRKKFMLRPSCILDGVIIIASIVVLGVGSSGQVFATSALRGLRFFQILRMMRMDRRGGTWKLLGSVVWAHRQELLTTLYIGFLGLIFMSFVVFMVEKEDNAKFTTYADALWWGVITLCTVGYGDAVPVTWAGKIIASFCALLGISFFALPAGILGSGFALKVQQQQRHKHLIRRRVPAAVVIQCLWRCYAADEHSRSVATWKRHLKPCPSPIPESVPPKHHWKPQSSFVSRFSTRRKDRSHSQAALGYQRPRLASVQSSAGDTSDDQHSIRPHHASVKKENSFGKDDGEESEPHLLHLTDQHKYAIRSLRKIKFFVARKKFREALRPYDVKDVMEQYTSGHLDMLCRIKILQTRLDQILGRVGSKNKDVYDSKQSLASRIVNVERQVEDIETKVDDFVDMYKEDRRSMLILYIYRSCTHPQVEDIETKVDDFVDMYKEDRRSMLIIYKHLQTHLESQAAQTGSPPEEISDSGGTPPILRNPLKPMQRNYSDVGVRVKKRVTYLSLGDANHTGSGNVISPVVEACDTPETEETDSPEPTGEVGIRVGDTVSGDQLCERCNNPISPDDSQNVSSDNVHATTSPGNGHNRVTGSPTNGQSHVTTTPTNGQSHVTGSPTNGQSHVTGSPTNGQSHVTTSPTSCQTSSIPGRVCKSCDDNVKRFRFPQISENDVTSPNGVSVPNGVSKNPTDDCHTTCDKNTEVSSLVIQTYPDYFDPVSPDPVDPLAHPGSNIPSSRLYAPPNIHFPSPCTTPIYGSVHSPDTISDTASSRDIDDTSLSDVCTTNNVNATLSDSCTYPTSTLIDIHDTKSTIPDVKSTSSDPSATFCDVNTTLCDVRPILYNISPTSNDATPTLYKLSPTLSDTNPLSSDTNSLSSGHDANSPLPTDINATSPVRHDANATSNNLNPTLSDDKQKCFPMNITIPDPNFFPPYTIPLYSTVYNLDDSLSFHKPLPSTPITAQSLPSQPSQLSQQSQSSQPFQSSQSSPQSSPQSSQQSSQPPHPQSQPQSPTQPHPNSPPSSSPVNAPDFYTPKTEDRVPPKPYHSSTNNNHVTMRHPITSKSSILPASTNSRDISPVLTNSRDITPVLHNNVDELHIEPPLDDDVTFRRSHDDHTDKADTSDPVELVPLLECHKYEFPNVRVRTNSTDSENSESGVLLSKFTESEIS